MVLRLQIFYRFGQVLDRASQRLYFAKRQLLLFLNFGLQIKNFRLVLEQLRVLVLRKLRI